MVNAATKNGYVIGTGEQHSVEEFLDIAFKHVGKNYKDYLKIDGTEPTEVETLWPTRQILKRN